SSAEHIAQVPGVPVADAQARQDERVALLRDERIAGRTGTGVAGLRDEPDARLIELAEWIGESGRRGPGQGCTSCPALADFAQLLLAAERRQGRMGQAVRAEADRGRAD